MIGLYPTGTTGSRGAIWSSYTTGARSGSFTLTAPSTGSYEFRYFINQAVYELAQTSDPVTLTSASGKNNKLIEWGWDSKLPQYIKNNWWNRLLRVESFYLYAAHYQRPDSPIGYQRDQVNALPQVHR
jgi:hypothetical protein